jgi:hypothetical protein
VYSNAPEDDHHDENRAAAAILCGEGRLYCVQKKPRHHPGGGTRGCGRRCGRVVVPPREAFSLFATDAAVVFGRPRPSIRYQVR